MFGVGLATHILPGKHLLELTLLPAAVASAGIAVTLSLAARADPLPGVAVVMMAYVIGALGGSLPLPASIGTIGGIAGMLIVYGIDRSPAVAAVLLHQAVALLVPVTGGAIAYLVIRRELGPLRAMPASAGEGAREER